MTSAKIETSLIAVTPITRADDGSRWLRIDVPNGWDDVKKLTKRVLSFEGRTYIFSCWNSDTYTCTFRESTKVAKLS